MRTGSKTFTHSSGATRHAQTAAPGVRLPSNYRVLLCPSTGGHKDHRQDTAGLGKPGEDLSRGEDHENAGPPTYH